MLVTLKEKKESWRVFHQLLNKQPDRHITATHNSLVRLGHMALVKARKCNPTMCPEAGQQKNSESIIRDHHTSISEMAYCVLNTMRHIDI